MSIVDSVFVGQPKKYIMEDGREWTSSIFREQVTGPVEVGLRGLAGDKVADTKNHGKKDMAVCLYPLSHYALWNAEHGSTLGAGGVGENLTVTEQTEDTVCIGDVYKIGSVVLQISQPRFPCVKQERRTGIEGFLKRVKVTRRVGWYARVLETGTLTEGDALTLTERPHPDITIAKAILPLLGPKNPDLARELKDVEVLSSGWKWMLRRAL